MGIPVKVNAHCGGKPKGNSGDNLGEQIAQVHHLGVRCSGFSITASTLPDLFRLDVIVSGESDRRTCNADLGPKHVSGLRRVETFYSGNFA